MHSAAPPLRLHRRDLKAGFAVLFLAVLLGGLTLLDIYGDVLMRRLRVGLALAGIALLMSGCTSIGQALVPDLKPMDAGIVFTTKCSDLAAKVAAAGPLEVGQLVALYTACETMQDGQRVKVDPQAARKAVAGKFGLGAVIP